MEAKEDSRSPSRDFDRERSFEGETEGGRESRSYSRSSMWKRRDDSWDRKWKNQVQLLLIILLNRILLYNFCGREKHLKKEKTVQ